MLRSLGKRLVILNLGVGSLAAAQYYAYYRVLPEQISSNFASCPLPDDPELAEPVLLHNEDTKFAFKHRGGSKAAQSLVFDAFENNNAMKRCIGSQMISSFCVSYALLQGKRFIPVMVCSLIVSSLSTAWRPIASVIDLYSLSEAVKQGDRGCFENLNEARFIQLLTAEDSSVYKYSQLYGYSLWAWSIIYCAPLYGSLFVLGAYVRGFFSKPN